VIQRAFGVGNSVRSAGFSGVITENRSFYIIFISEISAKQRIIPVTENSGRTVGKAVYINFFMVGQTFIAGAEQIFNIRPGHTGIKTTDVVRGQVCPGLSACGIVGAAAGEEKYGANRKGTA
jgi:hypothetical protein